MTGPAFDDLIAMLKGYSDKTLVGKWHATDLPARDGNLLAAAAREFLELEMVRRFAQQTLTAAVLTGATEG